MIDYVEIYVGEIYAETFTKSVPFRPVITWRLVYCTSKIYSSITKMLPELSNHPPVHNGLLFLTMTNRPSKEGK